MTALAPTLEAFFTDRLITQRRVSPRTVAAYRDSLRLLLTYAHQRTGKLPHQLDLTDLDAPLIEAFLNHLEHERGNSAATRNARLAAIHSLFRYASLRHPEHAALIGRVLAIPTKRHDHDLVHYLTPEETDALLAAPDRGGWLGRRDHAILLLAIQTGLRVSELAGLTICDVHLGPGPHVDCHGKGRKQRVTPLTRQTVTVLRVWLHERTGDDTDPLFPSTRGGPMSIDAIQWLLTKHATTAAQHCPSLRNKRVSPHVLRHTCAVNLLQAGVDPAVIALWLGHTNLRTTAIYLAADLTLKERALDRTAPPNTPPGRYRPPDELLAFLNAL